MRNWDCVLGCLHLRTLWALVSISLGDWSDDSDVHWSGIADEQLKY